MLDISNDGQRPHNDNEAEEPRRMLRRRFRLFLNVIAVVVGVSLIKAGISWANLEILTLNPLFTSAIAAAVFLIGFLLSSVLSDYKEADRMPADLRVSLEAIHDDALGFARRTPGFSVLPLQRDLAHVLDALDDAFHSDDESDMRPAIAAIDALSERFNEMDDAGIVSNMLVRLKAEQSNIRRCIFRIYHMQRIQFVPSVHILVQSLVAAIIVLLLLLHTEGSPESALIIGAITYMFIYALYLVDTLEQPFRKSAKHRRSLDDVSLFLLREFRLKLDAAMTPR